MPCTLFNVHALLLGILHLLICRSTPRDSIGTPRVDIEMVILEDYSSNLRERTFKFVVYPAWQNFPSLEKGRRISGTNRTCSFKPHKSFANLFCCCGYSRTKHIRTTCSFVYRCSSDVSYVDKDTTGLHKFSAALNPSCPSRYRHSFGDIYLGLAQNGERVAVKFEKHSTRCPQLRHEYKVYRELQNCSGFGRVRVKLPRSMLLCISKGLLGGGTSHGATGTLCLSSPEIPRSSKSGLLLRDAPQL